MQVNDKLELENVRKYHYVYMGTASFDKVFKKLDSYLKFYRFDYKGEIVGKEVIYDVANHMLSDSGIVISKNYSDNRISFNVRKISQLKGSLKRPSQKFLLGELEQDAEPKDYSLQISSAIGNSFSTQFTVDLDAFVRQTAPIIEIIVKAKKYQIIGGTGYRATLLAENAVYRDLKTKQKVSRPGLTLSLPIDEEWQEENAKILDIVDRKIKEIAAYNVSRFEIAQKLLYPVQQED